MVTPTSRPTSPSGTPQRQSPADQPDYRQLADERIAQDEDDMTAGILAGLALMREEKSPDVQGKYIKLIEEVSDG